MSINNFQFRATDRWESGTHHRFTIHGFYRAMQDMTHEQGQLVDAGHPADLVGTVACPQDLSGRNPSSSHFHDNLRRWLP